MNDKLPLPDEDGTAGAALTEVPAAETAEAPSRRRVWLWFFAIVGLLVVATAAPLTLACLGHPAEAAPAHTLTAVVAQPQPEDPTRLGKLVKRLAAVRPSGVYVVIDTYRNRLRVYRDGGLLREAVCSTGTGIVLRDPRNSRVWVFDTPLGERRVERKVKNPVWSKPDWAFIEEGYLPPPHDSEYRVDDFSLGDYALYLGDGYIIHGTIFQTLLGKPATHGCIRLGDQDLEYVYKTVPIGSRVFLY